MYLLRILVITSDIFDGISVHSGEVQGLVPQTYPLFAPNTFATTQQSYLEFAYAINGQYVFAPQMYHI